MMKFLSDRRALGVALGVVLITNAIALYNVWNNRSARIGTLTLSEREIRIPWQSNDDEDSGLWLNLEWRTGDAPLPPFKSLFQASASRGLPSSPEFLSDYSRPRWFNNTRLAEFGFDTVPRPIEPGSEGRFVAPRAAYVVLELDGPQHARIVSAMRRYVARVDSLAATRSSGDSVLRAVSTARAWLAWTDSVTRLYVVDGGRDADALRRAHPDSSRYAILPGTVRIATKDSAGLRYYYGVIDQVNGTRLNVPHRWRAAIDSVATRVGRPPRPVTVTVAIGRRHEPWIQSVRRR
ncbi:MAG TPA: DUF4824 family protein [Gemmatimonadaceae bacterium]|nr:DUF4824 family protein [Gemmatimonadaceae bacterium]